LTTKRVMISQLHTQYIPKRAPPVLYYIQKEHVSGIIYRSKKEALYQKKNTLILKS